MTKTGYEPLTSIDAITSGLESVGYISTREISTAIYLAHNLRKPILIEGPAGVGKTDLAASMARYLDVSLNRLPSSLTFASSSRPASSNAPKQSALSTSDHL